MALHTWQLQEPIDAVIFDCDGTLSTIEGIDTLAEKNGVGSAVKALTQEAMGYAGISDHLYRSRLDLVKPTAAQVISIAKDYYKHRVQDVQEVIQTFQSLKKSIYVISAGLYPSVLGFAELLGIPAKNVYAVNIYFDDEGQYENYEHTSPLVHRDGKRFIINELKLKHPHTLFIGDGMNDFAAYDLVTRFVGFGGSYYHQKIAEQSQFYIRTKSISPLLTLGLTHHEAAHLKPGELQLYEKGMQSISSGNTVIR